MVRTSKKPKKPYPDYPLTAHATGQWCKKIKGRIYYFGTDPEAALQKYLDTRDAIQAGRQPENYNPEGCTLRDAVNSFLTMKQHRVDAGELSPLTLGDYKRTCEELISHFGRLRTISSLFPADFERLRTKLAKRLNPTSLGDFIRRSRVLFKYAYETDLIDRPLRYGQSFSAPSRRTIRRSRQEIQRERGLRMYEAAELKLLLAKANPTMKTAILLGINCGFGATDIATLPQSAVDLDAGWIEFPRPKTAVERRIPLWPETVKRLRRVIDTRPAPQEPEDRGLCFLTQRGTRFVRIMGGTRLDVIARNFETLLRLTELKRAGVSFYALRHTFETIAAETRDQVAVDAIMGHSDTSMAAQYRQRLDDGRLAAVTEYVHRWLFAPNCCTQE